jgi:hypothetical protein
MLIDDDNGTGLANLIKARSWMGAGDTRLMRNLG